MEQVADRPDLALSPLPDLVLATGDLTDRGLREEYGLLGAILSRLPMPVLLLPGNHDRREEMRAALRALDGISLFFFQSAAVFSARSLSFLILSRAGSTVLR